MLHKKTVFLALSLAVIFIFSTICSAAAASKSNTAAKNKVVLQTFKGILIDKDCSGVKDPAKHSKECNLMPSCKKSGYGIDIKQKDGSYKFYLFDSKGTKLAEEYLSKTKKERNLTVIVKGSVKGTTISVSTLVEDNSSNAASKNESTASGKAGSKTQQEFIGWILDTDCVGVDPVKHTNKCNKMKSCIASGEGILVYKPGTEYKNYKFIPFDATSQASAVKLINTTKKEKNITIKVSGTYDGKTIHISTIKEYSFEIK